MYDNEYDNFESLIHMIYRMRRCYVLKKRWGKEEDMISSPKKFSKPRRKSNKLTIKKEIKHDRLLDIEDYY